MERVSYIKNCLRLYYVTRRDNKPFSWLVNIVKRAVEGGVTMVELREKEAHKDEIIELAKDLLKLLKPAGVPLIINDYPDVCIASNANGVHIGQEDIPAYLARKVLGPKAIIGISTGTKEEIQKASIDDAIDYIAIGTVFPTETKKDCKRLIGISGLASLVPHCTKPCIAIGGITQANVSNIMSTNPDGICVCMAIQGSEDPKKSSETLKNLVLNNLPNK